MPLGTEKTFDPVKEFKGYYISALHTGSRVICTPPPEDTDDDYMLLVDKDLLGKLENHLLELGFKLGGSGHNPNQHYIPMEEYPDPIETKDKSRFFRSYKKGFGDKIRKTEIGGYQQYLNAGRDGDKALRNKLEKDLINGIVVPPIILEENISDVVNVVLTLSPDYFENFRKATQMSSYLNLERKEHRIAMFQALCHDVWPD